jgi:hypothetical protein
VLVLLVHIVWLTGNSDVPLSSIYANFTSKILQELLNQF